MCRLSLSLQHGSGHDPAGQTGSGRAVLLTRQERHLGQTKRRTFRKTGAPGSPLRGEEDAPSHTSASCLGIKLPRRCACVIHAFSHPFMSSLAVFRAQLPTHWTSLRRPGVISFEGPGHGPRRVGARCGPQPVPDAGRGPGGRSYVFWTRSGPDAGRLHHRRRRGGASTARDDSGRRARHEQAPDTRGEAVIERSHVLRPSPEGSRQ